MPQHDEIQMESFNESLAIHSLNVFSFFLQKSPSSKILLSWSEHISAIITFNNDVNICQYMDPFPHICSVIWVYLAYL